MLERFENAARGAAMPSGGLVGVWFGLLFEVAACVMLLSARPAVVAVPWMLAGGVALSFGTARVLASAAWYWRAALGAFGFLLLAALLVVVFH